jgi:general secretion pathway protein I
LFQPTPFERQSAQQCTANEDLNKSAGFTLIEVLVALAVATISLAAIGSLMAGNFRGSGRIEQHIVLVETLRAVETGLPDRASLPEGTLTGDLDGQAWSVAIAPFPDDAVNPRAAQIWAPQMITVTVQSPAGASLQIETIRLVKKSGGPGGQ